VTAQPTLLDELVAAGRGVMALVIGDRTAPQWFDFSRRGLAGSFIALLVAQAISAYGPLLFGLQPAPGMITRGLVMVAVLFAAQVGCSALLLRQIGRLDGLVPYLVADNWATVFITVLSAILTQMGFAGDFALFAVGILVIVVEINIARIVVTLSAMQIVMFIVAQLVGVVLGLLVLGAVFPTPPDLAAAAQ
jgi:hypothetical protein